MTPPVAPSKNFAVAGVAGFVAPRHLKAIHETGNRLVAAVDPHDAVGILDRFSFDVRFFTELERFDRELEKRRLGPSSERVEYVSICSPNHLHDAHIRLALRCQAHAICEKPLVINPWNLDALQTLERESGFKVFTVLQLRLHPDVIALRERLKASAGDRKHEVCLSYITSRGHWYDVSWKGSSERSGGIIVNIGIHFFDLLLWLFGPVQMNRLHLLEPHRAAGFLELANARVRWFLSTNSQDLPFAAKAGGRTTFRSMIVDGREVEFSDGFADLHTDVYRQILAGQGPGIDEARSSIQLAHDIRHARTQSSAMDGHPMLVSSR